MIGLSRILLATGLLLLLSQAAACVTERARPVVVITGERVVPPREFLGRWGSSTSGEFHFRGPPAPAVIYVSALVVTSSTNSNRAKSITFDIKRIAQFPDGRVRFFLQPSDGGPEDERTFRLYEQDGKEWLVEEYGDVERKFFRIETSAP